MSAYAMAIVGETRFGPEIKEYLERNDATLAPFSGHFRIHDGPYHRLEGEWVGDLIMIEFPTLEDAQHWYDSPAYQAIKPLRVAHTEGILLLVAGVPEDHKATDIVG
jgi:uncharacterized protein (DUF1330 family)